MSIAVASCRTCPGDVEDAVTTLNGFITALSIVRWSDGLVTMPTDAKSWRA